VVLPGAVPGTQLEEVLDLSYFGDHLDHLLEERGMSRADLARHLGKSRQTLQTICATGNPRLGTLMAIKEALGLGDVELAELAKSAEG